MDGDRPGRWWRPRTCRLGELESGLQAEVAECGAGSLTGQVTGRSPEAAVVEQAPEQAEVTQGRTCWHVSWRLRSSREGTDGFRAGV